MKKTSARTKISYDPEADVLAWEVSNRKIDFATEVGNVVVHFSKNNMPVLIEVLEATSFLSRAKKLLEPKRMYPVREPALAAG